MIHSKAGNPVYLVGTMVIPLKRRHWLLLTCLLLLLLGNLLWAINDIWSEWIFWIALGGIALAYLYILYKEKGVWLKIIWTLLLVAGMCLEYLTTPLLVNMSWKIYLQQQQPQLEKIKTILDSINHDKVRYWAVDSSLLHETVLSTGTRYQLLQLAHDAGILVINKSETKLWLIKGGRLDNHWGIYYDYNPYKSETKRGHIKGNWYY